MRRRRNSYSRYNKKPEPARQTSDLFEKYARDRKILAAIGRQDIPHKYISGLLSILKIPSLMGIFVSLLLACDTRHITPLETAGWILVSTVFSIIFLYSGYWPKKTHDEVDLETIRSADRKELFMATYEFAPVHFFALRRELKNIIENAPTVGAHAQTELSLGTELPSAQVSSLPTLIKPKDDFYKTDKWRRLRYRVLRAHPMKCMLCGSEQKPMHVDHIKPRSKHPHLAYEITNLQILCEACNIGKSNNYEDDFRNHS